MIRYQIQNGLGVYVSYLKVFETMKGNVNYSHMLILHVYYPPSYMYESMRHGDLPCVRLRKKNEITKTYCYFFGFSRKHFLLRDLLAATTL